MTKINVVRSFATSSAAALREEKETTTTTTTMADMNDAVRDKLGQAMLKA